MWGTPTFSFAMFVSMLVATVTSVLESVGDYYAAARACVVPAPPTHAINRGIAVEGIGAVLSGLFGAAHATTSYSTPTALIRITGVLQSSKFKLQRLVGSLTLRAIHTDQFSGTSSRCQSTCTSKLACLSCHWYQSVLI